MKKHFTLLFLIVVNLCFANDYQPQHFKNYGVDFQYLSNWEITEESDWGWFSKPYVFLETENSGIIIINLFKAEEYQDLETFAKQFSDQVKVSSLFFGEFKQESIQPMQIEQHQGLLQKINFKLKLEGFEEDKESLLYRKYFSLHSDQIFATVILQSDEDDLQESIQGLRKILGSISLYDRSVK